MTTQTTLTALARVFTVFVNKANKSYEVDFGKLPEASQVRVIEYGIEQLFGDAAASVKFTDSNKQRLIGKALAAAYADATKLIDQRQSDLEAGIIRRTRSSSVDPVTRHANGIASRRVDNPDSPEGKAFYGWLAEKKLNKSHKDSMAEFGRRVQLLSADPAVVALATKRAAAEVEEMDALSITVTV